ncbi:tetraspanin-19 isoform X2 [Anoplopoma fimbria]|uniref:tetraspanin-19 isoform X2 n=1 Tax=Anoplopoma fimbria TaxID=229290 RepID=UPI0023EB43A9|nr:tetraspanin-19 isoform X2 [Anoplopoma fimbria]
MKLDVKIQLLNFCFEVFNFIFLALGLSVLGCGLWILFDGGSLLTVNPSDELRVVGAGLMLIGLVVLVVCVVGIIGAVRELRLLLLVYMGLLVVLVLGQLFVTLLLLMNREKIERGLDETVDRIISEYGAGNRSDPLMDKIQNYEGCCGRTGPSDWLKNSFIQSLNLTAKLLPCSCFRSSRPTADSPWCSNLNVSTPQYGTGNGSYQEGCRQKLSDWLQENILTAVGMDVALMLIQVLQFVFSVYLYRTLGRRAEWEKSDRLADPKGDVDYGEQNYAYMDPVDGYIDSAHPGHHHDYHEPSDAAHLDYDHGYHDDRDYD